MGRHFDSSWRPSNYLLLLLLRVQAVLSEAQEEGREEGAERSSGSQECSAARKCLQRKGRLLLSSDHLFISLVSCSSCSLLLRMVDLRTITALLLPCLCWV